MPRPARVPRLHAEVRPVEEMTELQIEALMNLGRAEAELMNRLEAAARAGDKNEVWKIAQEYCAIEDQIKGV
jgi:hypothetical protein